MLTTVDFNLNLTFTRVKNYFDKTMELYLRSKVLCTPILVELVRSHLKFVFMCLNLTIGTLAEWIPKKSTNLGEQFMRLASLVTKFAGCSPTKTEWTN